MDGGQDNLPPVPAWRARAVALALGATEWRALSGRPSVMYMTPRNIKTRVQARSPPIQSATRNTNTLTLVQSVTVLPSSTVIEMCPRWAMPSTAATRVIPEGRKGRTGPCAQAGRGA